MTPACVVSLFRPVELGIVAARGRQDGEWGSSVLPKAKMNILPPETGKLGLAVSGGSQFDLLTGQYTGSFVNVPVTWTFSETFKTNINAGWIYDHQKIQHFFSLRLRRGMDSDEAVHADRRGVRTGRPSRRDARRHAAALPGRPAHHADRRDRFRRHLRPQHPGRERELDHARDERTISGAGK